MGGDLPTLRELFSLEGKAALLTGAGGGIGHALALGLAGAGAAVALHSRTREKLADLESRITGQGGCAVSLTAELGVLDQARALVADAARQLGGLDILINCAATNRRKPVAEVTEGDWDEVMTVGLKSLYFMSQAAHAVMRGRGGGKIINIGSLTVQYALGNVSVYGAVKAAVAQLTRVMAVEWAIDNIQVNCVIPGFVSTPLSRPLWEDPSKAHWMRTRIPARRPAAPQELVGAVLLLASPASSYITGASIVVDGGVLAGGSWEPDPRDGPGQT